MKCKILTIGLFYLVTFLLNSCSLIKKGKQNLFDYSDHIGAEHICDHTHIKELRLLKVRLSPNLNQIFKLLPDTTEVCNIPLIFVKEVSSSNWKLDKNKLKLRLSRIYCKSCNGYQVNVSKYEKKLEIFSQKLKLLRLQENFLKKDETVFSFYTSLENPYCYN